MFDSCPIGALRLVAERRVPPPRQSAVDNRSPLHEIATRNPRVVISARTKHQKYHSGNTTRRLTRQYCSCVRYPHRMHAMPGTKKRKTRETTKRNKTKSGGTPLVRWCDGEAVDILAGEGLRDDERATHRWSVYAKRRAGQSVFTFTLYSKR